jgi:hypothetical protein
VVVLVVLNNQVVLVVVVLAVLLVRVVPELHPAQQTLVVAVAVFTLVLHLEQVDLVWLF